MEWLFGRALAEGAEATSWLQMSQNTWITVLAVALLAGVVACGALSKRKWDARMIAYGALCLALGSVLRYVRLFEMPQGGSVTLASMLPLMLFAAAYGVAPGMLLGAAFGFIRYMSGGWFVHPVQFLLDYPLCFALIGLTGLYVHLPRRWQGPGLYACMALGAAGRVASATLAGVFFWGTALWPSLVYNGAYLVPDTLICMVLALAVAPRLLKLMRAR